MNPAYRWLDIARVLIDYTCWFVGDHDRNEASTADSQGVQTDNVVRLRVCRYSADMLGLVLPAQV
jgi:hypothetical protein